MIYAHRCARLLLAAFVAEAREARPHNTPLLNYLIPSAETDTLMSELDSYLRDARNHSTTIDE